MLEEKQNKAERIIRLKMSPVLAEVFGYHALLFSNYAKILVKDRLLIRHQVIICNDSNSRSRSPLTKDSIQSSVNCLFEELPFASDSIDFAFLPEIIQNSDHPHQVLREVERVLIPEGVLVLIINNPMGFTSIKNQIKSLYENIKGAIKSKIKNETIEPANKTIKNKDERKLPWLQLGTKRISDWFNLLGIEKMDEMAVYEAKPRIAFKDSPFSSSTNFLVDKINETFADQIIIVGKKKVSTLTPVGLKWRKNKRLVRPRIAEPSVRHQAESCIRKIVLPDNIS